jgi:hypothetical protein
VSHGDAANRIWPQKVMAVTAARENVAQPNNGDGVSWHGAPILLSPLSPKGSGPTAKVRNFA